VRTAYELWSKPEGAHRYEQVGELHDDLSVAMTAAGYPNEADWRWANSYEINRVPTAEATARTGDTTSWLLSPKQVPENDADRITLATDLALEFGQIDGDHHKAWVIDQMLRALTGDRYEQVITEWCEGEDGPETYSWDEGIAP
jgi:hypothetical protein